MGWSGEMKLNHIWLWYSSVLLVPPVHEWGHVLIAWAIGERVVGMHWSFIELGNITSLDWIHDVWQGGQLFTLYVFVPLLLFYSMYRFFHDFISDVRLHTITFYGVGQQ
jgi:hypothetical protein